MVIALLAVAGSVSARGPSAWDGLAESAALKVGVAARQLARTAGVIAGEGRIGHLPELRTDAEDLLRRTDALVRLTEEALPDAPTPAAPAATIEGDP